MGRVRDEIDDALRAFCEAQPVFFVATAPLDADGHVNCSPRGNRGELAVLGPRQVAWLDQTGSGVETIAHLRENGRVVLMFCAFDGPPRVVRLHGRGTVVSASDVGFAELVRRFDPPTVTGARAVIDVAVDRISDSCGYGVPLMEFKGHRRQLDEWATRRGPDGVASYWADKNSASVDGLPGL
ncbi:MAG TPA: pyridoxamine 5'-phosphate oxidase family protein [Acidimicrobiales bacterium]|nr:pyridoxamine 5'-phosphate oxidase family protein [Acidimicrobiales bacterium]